MFSEEILLGILEFVKWFWMITKTVGGCVICFIVLDSLYFKYKRTIKSLKYKLIKGLQL